MSLHIHAPFLSLLKDRCCSTTSSNDKHVHQRESDSLTNALPHLGGFSGYFFGRYVTCDFVASLSRDNLDFFCRYPLLPKIERAYCKRLKTLYSSSLLMSLLSLDIAFPSSTPSSSTMPRAARNSDAATPTATTGVLLSCSGQQCDTTARVRADQGE